MTIQEFLAMCKAHNWAYKMTSGRGYYAGRESERQLKWAAADCGFEHVYKAYENYKNSGMGYEGWPVERLPEPKAEDFLEG